VYRARYKNTTSESFNTAGYSFTLSVVGVEPVVLGCHRSQTVAIGLRARDTGVRSDSDRETDHAYTGNRSYKYVGRHGNRFAMYDFLFDFNRHYGSILNRLAGNKLLPVYTSGL